MEASSSPSSPLKQQQQKKQEKKALERGIKDDIERLDEKLYRYLSYTDNDSKKNDAIRHTLSRLNRVRIELDIGF